MQVRIFVGRSRSRFVLPHCLDGPAVRNNPGTRHLSVVQPLQLTAPFAETCGVSGMTLLRIPPLARLPLVFSQAAEHLQIGLSDVAAAAGGRPVAELQDHGESVELVAGLDEGEVLVVVRDQRAGSPVPPLLVTVAVRSPHSVRLTPSLPKRLPLHASAEMRVHLLDANGAPLALSSSASVYHSVSHPSVLASQLTQTSEGGAFLRLRAIKEGCATVTVNVQVPYREDDSKKVFSDIVLLCVAPVALVGRHQQLLVQPGASVHLGMDMAAVTERTGAREHELLAFSIRLSFPPDNVLSAEELRRQLTDDLSLLLKLRSDSMLEAHLVPVSKDIFGASTVLDVDVGINLRELPAGISLLRLAEQIWFYPELRAAFPVLRFLDLGHGINPLLGSSLGQMLRSSWWCHTAKSQLLTLCLFSCFPFSRSL